jgi:hypothetical protein
MAGVWSRRPVGASAVEDARAASGQGCAGGAVRLEALACRALRRWPWPVGRRGGGAEGHEALEVGLEALAVGASAVKDALRRWP